MTRSLMKVFLAVGLVALASTAIVAAAPAAANDVSQ